MQSKAWRSVSSFFACTVRSLLAYGNWCASPSRATSRTSGCCSRSETSGLARLKNTTLSRRCPIASSPIRWGFLKNASRRQAVRPRAKESKIDLSAAVPAPLPAKLEPQLATLASALPKSGDWITETKLDGYRLLARIDKGRVKLFTRNGHDWTAKFPALTAAIKELPVVSAWLDGEIVVLKDGIPSFSALQNAIDGRDNQDIVFFLFDLMYLDGEDFRRGATLGAASSTR